MNAAPYPTQQGMATQQPQTVIVQNPAEEYPSFAVRKASSTGGIQLVLGILSIIFQISATAIEAEYGSTTAGIWAGFSVSLICITMVDTRIHNPRRRREPIFSNLSLKMKKQNWVQGAHLRHLLNPPMHTYLFISVFGGWMYWSDCKKQKIMLQGETSTKQNTQLHIFLDNERICGSSLTGVVL